jgi:hypothetical protein
LTFCQKEWQAVKFSILFSTFQKKITWYPLRIAYSFLLKDIEPRNCQKERLVIHSLSLASETDVGFSAMTSLTLFEAQMTFKKKVGEKPGGKSGRSQPKKIFLRLMK